MSKEIFMEQHDILREKYAEEHGIEVGDIPDDEDTKLADKAMARMSDRYADMIDRARERAKYGE